MKRGKKYLEAIKKLDRRKQYALREALELIKEISYANFDETIEVHLKLGVDPRHADQQVRGMVSLPAGSGKKVRILAFCKGENEKIAMEAGADYVGAEDLIEKIQGGWLEFDAAIATPDMMKLVSKLGRILGPRGLMPNPKLGTVTKDVAQAINELQAGKVEYRVDKTANIHAPIGKKSFTIEQLYDNAAAFLFAIIKARPSAAKGTYIQSITITSTMGPGIRLNSPETVQELKKVLK